MLRKLAIAADAVCKAYDVSFEDLVRPNRTWRMVWPRWVLATLLYEEAGMHPSDIASVLNRKGQMMRHARLRMYRELETNRKSREVFERLQVELRPKLNRALEAYPEPPDPKSFIPVNHRTNHNNKPKDQNGDH